MCDSRPAPASDQLLPRLTRRRLLQASAAASLATLASLVPGATAASLAAPGGRPGEPVSTALVDPYNGAIPLVFPVAWGTYRKPVWDNWHAQREGASYYWSHRNSASRAHDGIDIMPRAKRSLPHVYAPLTAKVSAVYTVSQGYQASADSAIVPPWDYSPADIYGNFVWLYSTDSRSAGYYVFYCHLQDEPMLQALAKRLVESTVTVDTSSAVGVMGESGNAAGEPQLHVEIHYPNGSSFVCNRCPTTNPPRLLTAINPHPSLANAARR